MKVQSVLVYPEWVQVAKWTREWLDSNQYGEAYKGRRRDKEPEKGSRCKKTSGSKRVPTRYYVCSTHNQTCSTSTLRHAIVKENKIVHVCQVAKEWGLGHANYPPHMTQTCAVCRLSCVLFLCLCFPCVACTVIGGEE